MNSLRIQDIIIKNDFKNIKNKTKKLNDTLGLIKILLNKIESKTN